LKIESVWFVSEVITNKDTTFGSRSLSHELLEGWEIWEARLIHLLLATFD